MWRVAVSGEAIGFTSSGHFQPDWKPARHTMSSPKIATLKWPSSSTAECGHGCQGSSMTRDITRSAPGRTRTCATGSGGRCSIR